MTSHEMQVANRPRTLWTVELTIRPAPEQPRTWLRRFYTVLAQTAAQAESLARYEYAHDVDEFAAQIFDATVEPEPAAVIAGPICRIKPPAAARPHRARGAR